MIRQPEDLGTQSAFAHALACLESGGTTRPGRLLMISGDIPLVTPAAISELLDRCQSRGVTIVPTNGGKARMRWLFAAVRHRTLLR